MTMIIDRTTLCICHHIHSMHNQGADCMLCRCSQFYACSRKSRSHYQRGQQTARKRVARLEPGDRILVGFTGHDEYVRGRSGDLVWVQNAGEITSHPLTRHVDDEVLRPVEKKTGALVATVTGTAHINHSRVIDTDLGELPPLPGAVAVHVLTESSPWL